MISKGDKGFLIIGLFTLTLCFAFYLIAFYPGFMSVDSVEQWRQLVEFKFNNWHPVVSTLFYYLCTRFWYSPASVAAAQIIILSMVFIYGIYVLIKLKVNKIILAVTILFFGLYPVNGLMSITLWKDIMYSIMLLWMTIIILEILITRGEWLGSRLHRTYFIVDALGVIFFRHNGILTFTLIIISLAIIYKKYRKKSIGIIMIVAIIYFIVTIPVFNALKVAKEPSVEALGIPMQQVAAVIKHKGMLNQHQKEFFNRILPLELWASEYNPYSTNPIKFHDRFDVEYAASNKKEFIENWVVLLINNPAVSVEAYLKQTSMIWRVVPLPDSYTYTLTPGIAKNDFGFKTIVLNQGITYRANRILSYTLDSDKMVYFWRPALWLYIGIVAALITVCFKGRKYLLLLIPMVSNSMAFMIATPAQDYRYQYANLLIAAILVPLAIHAVLTRKQVIKD